MPTDEDAIRNLIGRHSQLTDDGEIEARVQLYVADGQFELGNSTSTGSEELAAAFTASSSPERLGKHITSNTVIELDGSAAEARTDFLFLHPSPGGLTPLAAGRYADTFVKQDGRWLFRRRHITILGS